MTATQFDWEELAINRMYSGSRRLLVELYYYHDKSSAEIAESLQLDLVTITAKLVNLGLPLKKEDKRPTPLQLAECSRCERDDYE